MEVQPAVLLMKGGEIQTGTTAIRISLLRMSHCPDVARQVEMQTEWKCSPVWVGASALQG